MLSPGKSLKKKMFKVLSKTESKGVKLSYFSSKSTWEEGKKIGLDQFHMATSFVNTFLRMMGEVVFWTLFFSFKRILDN